MPQLAVSGHTSRAFALAEAVLIVLMVAALAALVSLLGSESRRQARLGEDIAKQHQIGALTASYASDNADLLWTFSWKKGKQYSPSFPVASTDLAAAAAQATEILHRVADRPDIQVPPNWFPHTMYSHLVLADYRGCPLPDLTFVSSQDKYRLKWARDPRGYDMNLYPPSPYDGTNASRRWPYSSSFQLPTAYYDQSVEPTPTNIANRLSQAATHSTWFTPNFGGLGPLGFQDVASPALKVHVHDVHARHFGRAQLFFGFEASRSLLLMADASAAPRRSADCNTGWRPQQPTSALPLSSFSYSPAPLGWEPNNTQGTQSPEPVDAGYYRFTRGFLAGRDHSAAEACSGQPGCP